MTSDVAPAPRGQLTVERLRNADPVLLLLILLAGASLVPASGGSGLRLATPDRSHVDQFRAAIGNLPSGALVLVAIDADLGTYPEIRSATRAALTDLAAHGAQLAVVSFTPDGRAIAAAELSRISRQGGGGTPLDLGYVAGAEAGLVRGISSIVPASAGGPIADAIRSHGGGIGSFQMALIVSGSDISARSWVEQVGPRVPALSMVAIAPTFLDPELEPYLRSRQLTALLATLREGVAYAETITTGSGGGRGSTPAPLPMLVGLLAALAVLAQAATRPLVRGANRQARDRSAS
jgi:hypothetical protein